MKKERNSNIELLRILSIIMIVISHYCGLGNGKVISSLNLGINRFLLESLILGNFGSVLFVIISGYYLISSNKIKLKKIMLLIFQISFYSISIYTILVLLNIQVLSISSLIKSIFPLTFKLYWFASAYVILYLFHPYINKLLNSFSQKEHISFNFFMFFIFSILQTLTTSDYYGNEIIQFLLFYSIGAYLAKYSKDNLDKKKATRTIVISAALMLLSIACIDLIGKFIPKLSIYFNYPYSIYFLSRTSPLVIIFCVTLFKLCSDKQEWHNKFVNLISSLVFGVYLISDNEFLRHYLWNDIFHTTKFASSPYLILHLSFTITVILIFCLIIELIRKKFIEEKLFKLLDPKIDCFQNKLETAINNRIEKHTNKK